MSLYALSIALQIACKFAMQICNANFDGDFCSQSIDWKINFFCHVACKVDGIDRRETFMRTIWIFSLAFLRPTGSLIGVVKSC